MPGHRHHRTDDQALRLKLAIFHALDSDTGTAGDARRLLKELAPLIEGWLTEAEGRAGSSDRPTSENHANQPSARPRAVPKERSSMKLTDDQRAACVQCRRGDHHLCWGHDGPMTSHPDSLPLCDCTCHPRLAKLDRRSDTEVPR